MSKYDQISVKINQQTNFSTVKLSKVNYLPNRTELNTSLSRRTALELLDYFCVIFVKSSVRFDRNELQN
jgi:hypothetical protein